MTQRKKADVKRDILHPVQEEHHAEQEQDVVITRDHVLGAKVDEGHDMYAPDLLDIARITGGDVMGKGGAGRHQQRDQGHQQ